MQGTIAFKTHIMDLGWATFIELKLRVDTFKYHFTCTHIKSNTNEFDNYDLFF